MYFIGYMNEREGCGFRRTTCRANDLVSQGGRRWQPGLEWTGSARSMKMARRSARTMCRHDLVAKAAGRWKAPAGMDNVGSLYAVDWVVREILTSTCGITRPPCRDTGTRVELGWFYERAKGHSTVTMGNDVVKLKGPKRDNAAAMNSIGLLYERGYGVQQDYTQAMTWIRRAADAGTPTRWTAWAFIRFWGGVFHRTTQSNDLVPQVGRRRESRRYERRWPPLRARTWRSTGTIPKR